jgi:hypothetical protein
MKTLTLIVGMDMIETQSVGEFDHAPTNYVEVCFAAGGGKAINNLIFFGGKTHGLPFLKDGTSYCFYFA